MASTTQPSPASSRSDSGHGSAPRTASTAPRPSRCGSPSDTAGQCNPARAARHPTPKAAALRNTDPTLSALPTRSSATTLRAPRDDLRHWRGPRPFSDRQSAAVHVESGDAVHHRLWDEIDRELPSRVSNRSRSGTSAVSVTMTDRVANRCASINRLTTSRPSATNSPCSVSSVVIGHVAIRSEPGVVRVLNANDGHGSIVSAPREPGISRIPDELGRIPVSSDE